MLPRTKRLTTPLFNDVFSSGKTFHSTSFSIRAKKTAGKSEQTGIVSRFAVSVSKKVLKSAVSRNQVKRRIYTAVAAIDDQIKLPVSLIFVMKPGVAILKKSVSDFQKEIHDSFVKMGILE